MSTATERAAESAGPRADEEAGTAPGDRRFRPDVEGLRAVAVLLVVLYHANFPGLSGGFVGVDVFFVISGFVITGLLLRERSSTDRTSLVDFYGRRVRRILPAATVVIVATTIASSVVLGVVFGDPTAVAARWTAVFLANFHFASIGTNYLASTLPPSPLQNFWSLAVEEQFYLVYPALFLVAASLRMRVSLRVRLTVLLVAIIAASFALSAAQTPTEPITAFFSPLTRAWELALGALIAVATPVLLTCPQKVAGVLTWVGGAAILGSAFYYTSASVYPGTLVAVPVIGAALVIAGGTCRPPDGAERLLARGPVQWLGRLSYSLYLWHWPILIIAAESAGHTNLPFVSNIGWLALSVVVAVLSIRLIEDPVRHAKVLLHRRMLTLGVGALLVAISVVVATVYLSTDVPVAAKSTPSTPFVPFSEAQLAQAVRASSSITSVPADLMPTLAGARDDWGGPSAPCWPTATQTTVGTCMFGDPHGTKTVAIYGDSHAAMWTGAMNFIAVANHWRLLVLAKGYCPVSDVPYGNPVGVGKPGGVYTQCAQWNRYALARLDRVRPDVVILTQYPEPAPHLRPYSPAQWQAGLERTIRELPVPPSHVIVLGNIPQHVNGGPQCLSLNPQTVQQCTGPPSTYVAARSAAEKAATVQTGSRYIDTVPWFCTRVCSDVIGHYLPYWDSGHVTATYAAALVFVLGNAIDLPSYGSSGAASTPTSTSAPSRRPAAAASG